MRRSIKALAGLISSSLLFKVSVLTWLPTVQAQTPIGSGGCPTGTTDVNSPNLVQNGNFAQGNVGFTTDPSLEFQGINQYGEGYAIVNDTAAFRASGGFAADVLEPSPFPGDPTTNSPASESYYYSNPANDDYLQNAGAPILWQQDVAVQPNTAYNFLIYLNNVLQVRPGDPEAGTEPDGAGYPPVIELRVSDGVSPPRPLTDPPSTIVRTVPDQWVLIRVSFVTGPGQRMARLAIVDAAGRDFGQEPPGSFRAVFGDDFSFTAVGLRECIPVLGVAKSVGTPVQNANGTYTIPYTVTVRNFAPAESQYTLNNLQLVDNLAKTFANATVNSVTSIQSPTLTVNPNFGVADPNLLQPGVNSLAGQTTATVTYSVNITPGSGPNGSGPFDNQVRATATSQGGQPVSDDSNAGTNPDPDGDNNPSNNSSPTRVTLQPLGSPGGSASFILVKRITGIRRGGVPLGAANFVAFVDDPNSQDDNAPGWVELLPERSPIGVLTVDTNNPVQSGDEVEYTVYFLSAGTAPTLGTTVCDLIPAGTTLIPNTPQVRIGNGSANPSGETFTPLAPLPDNNSCSDQRNPNGAVIFNLGNVTNTPSGNVGFVRLRVRVN